MKPLLLCALALAIAAPLSNAPAFAQAAAQDEVQSTYANLDADFSRWMSANNVPGMVWGVVANGRLVHVKALGVQAIGPKSAPVTADTGFRIASMSKAFTGHAILALRDQGKLRLDDPVYLTIPEVQSWAPDLTVADLLHHTAGFVTDDPWGDRQQPMSEAEFTWLLKHGVPRTAPRGSRFEYSNLGYAMLGRIISNVTGKNFSAHIAQEVFVPLGMTATTYENAEVPPARRAIGYRWEDQAWREEPTMAHGAFGAMGGITTSANDYAKWIAHLLAAWPADDKRDDRASIRAMQSGGGLPQLRNRYGSMRSDCKLAAIYGAGLLAGDDCALGHVLFHGGGFPGYGSHMLLMPDAGVGVFAMTNRTYTGASGMVWDAATRLSESGKTAPRQLAISAALERSYDNVRRIWTAGSIEKLDSGALAVNFTMDRDAVHWARDLTALRAKTGECDIAAPPKATGRLSGRFSWNCAQGILSGTVLLAPDHTPSIQSLAFDFAKR